MALPLALVAPAMRIGAIGAAAHTAFEKLGEYDSQAKEFYSNLRPSNLPEGGGWNDAQDAFRHAYASARLAQDAGETVSHAMGTLNEYKGMLLDRAPSAETGMDLWNNRVGREIARDLPANASPQDVAEAVFRAMDKGLLVHEPSDPRAKEGAREVATEERLAQGAFNLFSNPKEFFANLRMEDLPRSRETLKELPPDMINAMASGLERAPGFDNASLQRMAEKMNVRSDEAALSKAEPSKEHAAPEGVARERGAVDQAARSNPDESRSNPGGFDGVRIPGVNLGRQSHTREMERER